MLSEALRNQIEEVAKYSDQDAAGLMAVVDVESGGQVFARIKDRQEPLIRFEGHYFYRLLGNADRNKAVVQGLADRRAGKIKNSRWQIRRWKMLDRAIAIDRDAALQSTSWGVGQVMGIHWRWLGYASLDQMIARTRSGLDGQIEVMLRFIEKSGLSAAMRDRDWKTFARSYNGSAYYKNQYDRKLEKAYQQYARVLGQSGWTIFKNRNARLLLKMGDRGDLVRDLQLNLKKAGIMLACDGDFGPVTRRAVMRFQRIKGLVVDGLAGPCTFEMLQRVI